MLQTSTMSIKDLFKVNKNSIIKQYNRTFYEESLFEVVKKETAMSTNQALALNVLIIPLIVHKHRDGVPCEPHIRTQVQYSTKNCVYLDMTYADFEQYAMPVE